MRLVQLENLEEIAYDVTDERYGFRPFERPLQHYLRYGFIPLDKPPGPTSHEVVATVRRLLGLSRAGHSGTLDPHVSGVLPIGLEEATKALGLFLLGPKEYVTVGRLHHPVDLEKLMAVLREFTGAIYQKPPLRASVKKETRIRHVYELELVEKKGNLFLIRANVEAGTYIRKLIFDIGEVLGVGASMVELRRTRVCDIDEKALVRLHDVYLAQKLFERNGDARGLYRVVRPIEQFLTHVKAVVVRDSAVDALCHGARLTVPGIVRAHPNIEVGDTVCIYTLKGELIAIGKASMSTEQITVSKKGVAVETDRVIMERGLYPRMWKSRSDSTLITR
jgi:H/ACA ribonucleoprotein complex subunit 4